MLGWKLFEVTHDGQPRTLVHGFDVEGVRGRIFLLDYLHYHKPYTPGFNFFPSKHLAIQYLPRFRVRAPRLCLCAITAHGVHNKPNSIYTLANEITISSADWSNRLRGEDIL